MSSGKNKKLNYKEPQKTVEPSDIAPAVPVLGIDGKPIQQADAATINKYSADLFDPANRELTDTYNLQLGKSATAANNAGVMNSIGFQDYKQNSLDKNLAEGRADLQSQARLQAIETVNTLLNQDYENKVGRANLILGENQNQNNHNLGAYQARSNYDATKKGWLKKIGGY